jgi:hypothetical protein
LRRANSAREAGRRAARARHPIGHSQRHGGHGTPDGTLVGARHGPGTAPGDHAGVAAAGAAADHRFALCGMVRRPGRGAAADWSASASVTSDTFLSGRRTGTSWRRRHARGSLSAGGSARHRVAFHLATDSAAGSAAIVCRLPLADVPRQVAARDANSLRLPPR